MSGEPQWTGKRRSPYKNFRFHLKIDGKKVAGITKVGGLKRTTEVIEHRAGGDPATVHLSPGQSKFEAITLEKGVTHNLDFDAWARQSYNFGAKNGALVSLANFRKDLTIELLNEAGQVVVAYTVFNCWVSEYNALPELDSSGNAVAIQSITVQNEGWERDRSIVQPEDPDYDYPSSS